MKVLLGYMCLAMTMLLGFMGGLLFYTFLVKYEIPWDTLSFILIIWNFAIVGIIAIFYQKGIPMIITQAYLVAISVIMAWQLSHFEDWTGWSLLVVLALYDLCAVLTPCGPLKYLVGLMQEYNEPMPGLLYEAQVDAIGGNNDSNNNRNRNRNSNRSPPPQSSSPSRTNNNDEIDFTLSQEGVDDVQKESCLVLRESAPGSPSTSLLLGSGEERNSLQNINLSSDGKRMEEIELSDSDEEESLLDTSGVKSSTPSSNPDRNKSKKKQQKTSQLRSVDDSSSSLDDHKDKLKRTEKHEKTTKNEEQKREDLDEEENDDEMVEVNTIKLGLGDFVFYSVLVSKAALYGFPTFLTCFLVIISGLGATLVLLSVFKKALPALPISIFLGVAFYLLTRSLIMPFIELLQETPIYL